MEFLRIELDDYGGDSDVAIGRRLEWVRLGLGMTQVQFSASIGVSPRSLHYYERGTRSVPADVLRQLRRVHGLDLMWVLVGRGLPREGEDDHALAEFVTHLSAEISGSEAVLPPESWGKIVSRWFRALHSGRRVAMKDVRDWVDLLKE